MTDRIEYLQSVVGEDIPKLSSTAKKRVRRASEKKLTTHPIEFGKPFRYSLQGARRLRVGDYRVIYQIESPGTVLILKIGNRREVYED